MKQPWAACPSPSPALSWPSPGEGSPRQPSTGLNGVVSLLRCCKERLEFSTNEDQAAAPFPGGPGGCSQPGASAACSLQCLGQLTLLGRPGLGGGVRRGGVEYDRSSEPSQGSLELRVSDGLYFCFCSQLGAGQAAESSRRTHPPERHHRQVLRRASGGSFSGCASFPGACYKIYLFIHTAAVWGLRCSLLWLGPDPSPPHSSPPLHTFP